MDSYLNVTEVESALTGLAGAHPGLCERIELPNPTYEGRICHALRIGTGAASERDGILFIGGVPAPFLPVGFPIRPRPETLLPRYL